MALAEQTRDHLSQSERAVCYFTLPRILSPVSLALMLGYAVMLTLAAAMLVAGVHWEYRLWIRLGSAGLALLVALGMVAFFTRALRNDVRGRRALRRATALPDTGRPDDLPDPFSGHVLLKHPVRAANGLYSCTHDDGTIAYFVEKVVGGRRWRVRSAHDAEVCRIEALRGMPSFSFLPEPMRRLKVTGQGDAAAEVFPVASLKTTAAEIRCLQDGGRKYMIERNGIYYDGRLVGRIYALRQFVYLDIEEEHLNPGVLAYFVANS